jgi:hypothetical protein
MSTRAAIARAVDKPGGGIHFEGRYHHWDGYPTGLGRTLYQLYNGYFERDLDAMLKFLIDDHPGGWSTINDRDLSLPIGFSDDNLEPCEASAYHVKEGLKGCGRPCWEHFQQYYAGSAYSHRKTAYDGSRRRAPKPPAGTDNGVLVLGHVPLRNYERPRGPECYCHGSRDEDGWVVTEENAAGSGCEWVYLLKDTPDGAYMMVLSSYTQVDGVPAKMIGMFGMGDPNAEWKPVAVVGLDTTTEPDWAAIEGREEVNA